MVQDLLGDFFGAANQQRACRPILRIEARPAHWRPAALYYLALLYNFFTRALGMMLIGMALFSWGVVSAGIINGRISGAKLRVFPVTILD